MVSIQVTIARRSSSRVARRLVFRTFFCGREKKISMAALSLLSATRPVDDL